MIHALQGALSLAGRVLLCTIFLMSAAGNKIPQFDKVVDYMERHHVPAPRVLLSGAIVFLLVGSLSVIAGYKARFGAALLAVFLVLATFYFHNFWTMEGEKAAGEMIQFMKNLSMLGAMLFIVANGPGAFSLDARLAEGSPAR